jgi:hypothetical protein
MIRESNFISERVVRGTLFRQVLCLTTDSKVPDQMVITYNRFIGEWAVTVKKILVDGEEIEKTTETDLDEDELEDFEDQWELNWTDDEKMVYNYVSEMEVNGTILRQEMTLDFDENDESKVEITSKRSIDDKSITMKKRQEGEIETEKRTDTDLTVLEILEFEEQWEQLWKPNEST